MAHYVARKTGTSVKQAVDTVHTAQRLDPHGATAEALKSGELSVTQATTISDAVAADAHAERELLEIHHRDPVNNDGSTSAKNCCRLCRWHHYLCTHHGWDVEGSAEDGWALNPPTGRAPPDDLKLAV